MFPEVPPTGWTQRTLGSIATHVRRVATQPAPIMMISSAKGFIHQSEKYERFMAGKSLEKYILLEQGEFAYNRGNSMRFPQGCIFRLEENPAAAVPNVYICFRVDSSVDHRFLSFFFRSGSLNEQLKMIITSGVRGNGLLNIKADDFFGVKLLLPPLADQRRIAEILQAADDAVATAEAVIDQTEKVKRGLVEELLTRGMPGRHSRFKMTEIGELPESWEVVSIGDVLNSAPNSMRSGPFGSQLLKEELVEAGIPLLGIDNIHAERFQRNYKRFVTPEKANELRRYFVKPNDVAITIMGTVGRCCLIPEDVGQALSSKHIWVLTLDATRLRPYLLVAAVAHLSSIKNQFRAASQGAVMEALSSSVLRSTLVPLPSLEEQIRMEKVLRAVDDSLACHRQQLAVQQASRDGLQAELLAGRQRVCS
jgi:type I restriction enzyme S subunit